MWPIARAPGGSFLIYSKSERVTGGIAAGGGVHWRYLANHQPNRFVRHPCGQPVKRAAQHCGSAAAWSDTVQRTPAPMGSAGGERSADRRRRSVEVVERGCVPTGDERPLVGRYVLEVLGQRLARMRPRRVAVRVIRRPHDVAEPRPMPCGHPREVADEGGVPLAVPVRARLLGDDRLGPEPMLLEGLVHALDEVGDPADAALDEDEPELRVSLEDSR